MPKSIVITNHGGPEVLEFKDVTVNSPGPKEIKIKNQAIGINFIDTYHRSGLYKIKLPSSIGMEAAAEIIEIGSNVKNFNVGDRIAYSQLPLGSYSEERIIPEAIAVKMKQIRNVIFNNARIIFHKKQVSDNDKYAFEELLLYCYGRTENLFGNDRKENKIVNSFSYDFEKWQKDLNNNKLNYFKLDTSFNIEFTITKKQFKEVEDVLKLFGNTPAGRAKTIIRIGPKTLWRTPVYYGQKRKFDDPVIRPSSINTGP